MAQIQASNDTSMLKIKSFLGLNENPDGSTALKVGEMSEMRNFRITKDGHLQIRPGSKKLLDLSTLIAGFSYDETHQYLHGVWNGIINNVDHTLVAFGGHIFDVDLVNKTATDKGTCTEDDTSFFGFSNKVYMLNGHEYMSWDGQNNTNFVTVSGYIPTITIGAAPATGEGTKLEERNNLIGTVKIEFSATGSATLFKLGEKDITSVDEVKVNDTVVTTGYTTDLVNGTVTFSTAPSSGTNNVVIKYTKSSNSNRALVEAMHYAELFNGNTDTRVFIYGNKTNKALYSGIETESKLASAEYFPENYEMLVGEENTPITSLVRHYSRMMAYKPNSTYQINGQLSTLSDGTTTINYYITPVNRQFGNEAEGQVKLLENNPISLDSGAAFQWKAYTTNSTYASSEQNASRISDNVSSTLKGFDFSKTKTNNLKFDREFWFMYGNKALILNYNNNSWYIYENLPFQFIQEIDNVKYGFANTGKIFEFSRENRNDEKAIEYTFDSTDWEASEYGGVNGTFRIDYDGSKWHIEEDEVDISDLGFDLASNPTKNSLIVLERTETKTVTTATEVEGLTVTVDGDKFLAAYKREMPGHQDFPTGTYTVTYNGVYWIAAITGQGSKTFGSTEDMATFLFITVTGTPASGNAFTITYTDTFNYNHNEYSAIDAYSATGAMDFDKDWLLKYSPMLFVATQPESNSRVTVTVESNKRSDYAEKVVANSISTFLHLDFNHFSFGTNRKPQVKRLKIKVKKATYYKMIFKSNSTSATATILETDVKLRYAGEVKK